MFQHNGEFRKEEISIKSKYLMPFRTKSKIHDKFPMTVDMKMVQGLMNKLLQFEKMDCADQIIQLLRGRLYFAIKTILTNPQNSYLTLEQANNFINQYLKFFIKYILSIQSYLVKYEYAMNLNPALIQVDAELAIVSAYEEMFEIVANIFGYNFNKLFYYLNNQFDLINYSHNITKTKKVLNNQILNFINYYQHNEGVKLLTDLMVFEQPTSQNVVY